MALTDGDHDLFGDGLVTCIATTAHTPGHQSLRVRLADVEVVLAADCAYFTARSTVGRSLRSATTSPRTPPASTWLRAMRAAGTAVIPGHDKAALDALPATMG